MGCHGKEPSIVPAGAEFYGGGSVKILMNTVGQLPLLFDSLALGWRWPAVLEGEQR